MYRAAFLCLVPMLLLITFFFPLRTPAPTRDQLRDALHDLDNLAYAQSGCSDVAAALTRCQQATSACNTLYAQELRNLSRNCRSISTNELEQCLMDTPGGKCVFERLASDCGDGIREILSCHKAAMTIIVSRVLKPLSHSRGSDGPGSGGDSSSSGGSGSSGGSISSDAASRSGDSSSSSAATTTAEGEGAAQGAVLRVQQPPGVLASEAEWIAAAAAAGAYSAAADARAEAGRLSLLEWALPHTPIHLPALLSGLWGGGDAQDADAPVAWPRAPAPDHVDAAVAA